MHELKQNHHLFFFEYDYVQREHVTVQLGHMEVTRSQFIGADHWSLDFVSLGLAQQLLNNSQGEQHGRAGPTTRDNLAINNNPFTIIRILPPLIHNLLLDTRVTRDLALLSRSILDTSSKSALGTRYQCRCTRTDKSNMLLFVAEFADQSENRVVGTKGCGAGTSAW